MAVHELGLLIEHFFSTTGGPASLITGDAVIYAEIQTSTLHPEPDADSGQSQHPMEVAEVVADNSGETPAVMVLINALLRR